MLPGTCTAPAFAHIGLRISDIGREKPPERSEAYIRNS
ncbi:hypothetical protein SBDP1_110031 [Syntrophobacter sp. SbD1]|nr:hypothetical protein SBDP1_110031 [Syntrophobacter sp. SbD1]